MIFLESFSPFSNFCQVVDYAMYSWLIASYSDLISIQSNPIYFKEQVEDMKRKEERMEKQMNEIMAENRRLTEPLQRAREEVQELQKEVWNMNICIRNDDSNFKSLPCIRHLNFRLAVVNVCPVLLPSEVLLSTHLPTSEGWTAESVYG